MKLPTFEEAWAKKEAQGYLYGRDALEQVKLGWQMALDALAPFLAPPTAQAEPQEPLTEQQIQHVADRVRNTLIVADESPEELREAIAVRVVSLLRGIGKQEG